MPLPPQSDHRVTRAEAAEFVRRQREAAGKGDEVCGFFFRKPVEELLAQKGCAGIRIYNGRNEKGGPAMVLVGVDEAGNDMAEGVVLERHYPCPPFCDESGLLTG